MIIMSERERVCACARHVYHGAYVEVRDSSGSWLSPSIVGSED